MSIKQLLTAFCITLFLVLSTGCGGGSGGGNDNGGDTTSDGGGAGDTGGGDSGDADSGDGDGGDSGSGGDSGTTTASAEGLWSGTVTDGETTYNVAGLIHDGYMVVLDEDQTIIYEGSYTVSADTLDGNITIYQPPQDSVDATLSATVTTGDSIDGTYNVDGGGSGNVSLSYDAIYDRDVTLADLSANWTRLLANGATLTLSIDSAGNITGSDTSGCVYNGTATLIDPGQNLFRLDVEITDSDQCGNVGDYTGYAALFDNATTQNSILQVALSSDTFIFIEYLERS